MPDGLMVRTGRDVGLRRSLAETHLEQKAQLVPQPQQGPRQHHGDLSSRVLTQLLHQREQLVLSQICPAPRKDNGAGCLPACSSAPPSSSDHDDAIADMASWGTPNRARYAHKGRHVWP